MWLKISWAMCGSLKAQRSEVLGMARAKRPICVNALVVETIPKSFGLEAATQGYPDGNDRYRRIFTDTSD